MSSDDRPPGLPEGSSGTDRPPGSSSQSSGEALVLPMGGIISYNNQVSSQTNTPQGASVLPKGGMNFNNHPANTGLGTSQHAPTASHRRQVVQDSRRQHMRNVQPRTDRDGFTLVRQNQQGTRLEKSISRLSLTSRSSNQFNALDDHHADDETSSAAPRRQVFPGFKRTVDYQTQLDLTEELASGQISKEEWAHLMGGGARKVRRTEEPVVSMDVDQQPQVEAPQSSPSAIMDWIRVPVIPGYHRAVMAGEDLFWIGSLAVEQAYLSVRVKIDLGRYGDPHIQINLRVHKDWKAEDCSLKVDTPRENYFEFNVSLRPGVLIDDMRVQRFSERSVQEGASDPALLGFEGSVQDIDEKVMCLKLVTSGYRTAGVAAGDGDIEDQINEIPGMSLDFAVSILKFLTYESTIEIYLLQGGGYDEFVRRLSMVFTTAVENHLPPFFQYRDLETPGYPCNVSETMLAIDQFENGMYINVSKEDIKAISEGKKEPEYNETRGFHRFPKTLHWFDGKSFESAFKAGVVREMQYVQAQSARLGNKAHPIFLQKTFRVPGPKPDRRAQTDAVNERIDSFYTFVRLSRDAMEELLHGTIEKDAENISTLDLKDKIKELLPLPGTIYNLDWDNSDPAEGKPHVDSNQNDMWVGRVIQVPNEWLTETGTDICLLVRKPRASRVFVKGFRDRKRLPTKALPTCHLYAKMDTTSHMRQMEALEVLSDESNSELSAIQKALLYDKESAPMNWTDIRGGPMRGRNAPPTETARDIRMEFYDKVVEHVTGLRNMHEGQTQLLFSAGTVPDRMWPVIGAPGVQKTGTMADLAMALLAVGHTVWICADADAATNHAASRCHETLETHKEFIPKLKAKKGLRFAPQGTETSELLKWARKSASPTDVFTTSGRDLDPTADPSWKHTLEELENLFENEDVDGSRTFDDFENFAKERQDNLNRIKEDYNHMAFDERKKLEYPMEWSMVYRIHQQVAADAEAHKKELAEAIANGTDIPTNPSARYAELYRKAVNRTMTGAEPKQFKEERTKMFCRIIAGTDIFFTTANNMGSSIVQDALQDYGACPTVMMLEEAGQMSIPSAAIPLSISGIEAVYMFGDPQQLTPLVLAAWHSEWAEIMEQSILAYVLSKDYAAQELMVQFRMAPAISQWPNQYFYQGRMVNHPSTINPTDPDSIRIRQVVRDLSKDLGIKGPDGEGSEYFGVNTKFGRATGVYGSTSLQNRVDAQVMIKLAKKFIDNGVEPHKISMICFYRGQLRLIDVYRESGKVAFIARDTIYAFQGRDNRVVLVDIVAAASLAKSEGHGVTSFARSPNRLNVALSRARDGCIVVGSMSTMISAWASEKKSRIKENALAAMVQDLGQRGLICHDDTKEAVQFISSKDAERLRTFGNNLVGLRRLIDQSKLKRRIERNDVEPVSYVSRHGRHVAPWGL